MNHRIKKVWVKGWRTWGQRGRWLCSCGAVGFTEYDTDYWSIRSYDRREQIVITSHNSHYDNWVVQS